uniref:Uncharacterized protein n=1 Tax=Knipowitschia caucasica TaxID=637954 RepID=A0AAV2M748_KNICA
MLHFLSVTMEDPGKEAIGKGQHMGEPDCCTVPTPGKTGLWTSALPLSPTLGPQCCRWQSSFLPSYQQNHAVSMLCRDWMAFHFLRSLNGDSSQGQVLLKRVPD